MQKYLRRNDHCPYCGGSLRESAGELMCEYCLERVEQIAPSLGYGFDLLKAGDFEGAQKFFYGAGEASASYGLFLAMHKIDENQVSATEIDPIIYELTTTSYIGDRYYVNAKKRNAKNKIILRRLDQIEQARVKNIENAASVDVVTVGDVGAATEILRRRAYVVSDNCENAIMRSASVMLAYAATDEQMYGLVDSGIVERFCFLRQGALLQKRAIIFTSVDIGGIVGEITRLAQFVAVSSAAEIGKKLEGMSLPAPRKKIEFTIGSQDKKVALVEPKQFIPYVPLGEIRNDDAALARLKSSVADENFSDAVAIATKLINRGVVFSDVYFYKALAQAAVTEDGLKNAKDLPSSALESVSDAIAHSQNTEIAKGYIDSLAKVALNAIGCGDCVAASKILDAINAYGLAVSANIVTAMCAALASLAGGSAAEQMLTLEKIEQNTGVNKSIYEAKSRFISRALAGENYEIAEKYARENLASAPQDSKNLENLLCVENKASNFSALIKSHNLRLGGSFKRILESQSSAENALAKLELYFDVILEHAKTDGKIVERESVFDELLSYSFGKKAIAPAKICALGDYCLSALAFSSAKKYFVMALSRDAASYAAYWGLLKAELECATDNALIDSDTDITTVSNYYSNAHTAAFLAKDQIFLDKIQKIKTSHANAEYNDGCVFRKSDYDIDANDKITRYKGLSSRVWLPSNYVNAIGVGAFWGNKQLREVKIGEGVVTIESEAFGHCPNLTTVTLPSTLSECDNAFVGCDKLTVTERIKNINNTSVKKGLWAAGSGWESLLGGMSNNFAVGKKTKNTNFTMRKVFSVAEKIDGGILSHGGALIYCAGKKAVALNEKTYEKIGKIDLTNKIVATGCFIGEYLVLPLGEGFVTLYVFGASGNVYKRIPITCAPTKSLRSYKNWCVCVCDNKVLFVDIFSGDITSVSTEHNVCQPTLIDIGGNPTLILGGTDSVSGINLNNFSLKKLYALSGAQIAKNTTSKIGYDRLVEHGGKVYFLENKNSQYALTALDGVNPTRVIALSRSLCFGIISQPIFCGNKAYIGASNAVLSADITQEYMNFTAEKSVGAPYIDFAVAGGQIIPNYLTDAGVNVRFRAIIGDKILAFSNEGDVYGIEL